MVEGANVDAADENGSTPLHMATKSNNVDIMNVLITAGTWNTAWVQAVHHDKIYWQISYSFPIAFEIFYSAGFKEFMPFKVLKAVWVIILDGHHFTLQPLVGSLRLQKYW